MSAIVKSVYLCPYWLRLTLKISWMKAGSDHCLVISSNASVRGILMNAIDKPWGQSKTLSRLRKIIFGFYGFNFDTIGLEVCIQQLLALNNYCFTLIDNFIVPIKWNLDWYSFEVIWSRPINYLKICLNLTPITVKLYDCKKFHWTWV